MSILVVEDSPMQRVALLKLLRDEGFDSLCEARSARDALAVLDKQGDSIDLILSDINMPGISGIEACRQIKSVPAWHDIPVIMVTSSDDLGDLQEAFEAGATDYIMKPPKRIELLARVRGALNLKYETDARKAREYELREERDRSEWLLLNILPQPIAERLKHDPNTLIVDHFDEATVMFVDLVGFTTLAAQRTPEQVGHMLNCIFSAFDTLAEAHGLEKIKTIGDAYMVVGGLPTPRPDHVEAVMAMATDLRNTIDIVCGEKLEVRIGIHTGPVVAGVIGRKKFSYDLWGDTVNIASRMESYGCPGSIHVTEAVVQHLWGNPDYHFVPRQPIEMKGLGVMNTYLLDDGA